MRSMGIAVLIAVAASGRIAAQEQVSYEGVRTELDRMTQSAVQVAQVDGIVIERDVARLTLERGRVWLLQPVNGRTVAAAFQGSGRFAFAPTDAVEQREVARVHRSSALDVPIDEVILLFSDSTLAELQRSLRFEPAGEPLSLPPSRIADVRITGGGSGWASVGALILDAVSARLELRTTDGTKLALTMMTAEGILAGPAGGEIQRAGVEALGRWFADHAGDAQA